MLPSLAAVPGWRERKRELKTGSCLLNTFECWTEVDQKITNNKPRPTSDAVKLACAFSLCVKGCNYLCPVPHLFGSGKTPQIRGTPAKKFVPLSTGAGLRLPGAHAAREILEQAIQLVLGTKLGASGCRIRAGGKKQLRKAAPTGDLAKRKNSWDSSSVQYPNPSTVGKPQKSDAKWPLEASRGRGPMKTAS